MILIRQAFAQFFLVWRRLPRHVVDLVVWTEVILRSAMTIDAPSHVKRLGLPGERHLVDLPMTGGTAHAFGDVDAVVEVGEIGQIMHPIPFQRLVRRQTVAHRRE